MSSWGHPLPQGAASEILYCIPTAALMTVWGASGLLGGFIFPFPFSCLGETSLADGVQPVSWGLGSSQEAIADRLVFRKISCSLRASVPRVCLGFLL